MPPVRRSTPAHVTLSNIKNSDDGLKVKYDAKKQSLTIKGTAHGVETRIPGDTRSTHAQREKQSDFEKMEEFGGSIGIEFDKDAMPKFDTTNGYTEKNKWYFAHCADIGTKAGQSAEQVAKAIAAKVNGNGDYAAKVVKNADGSATLTVDWK
ncbi:MAG: hypothetical protein QM817_30330 [Archangium sp.]